jgi:hypothetical protein
MKTISRILGGFILALAFIGAFALTSSILDRNPPIAFNGARALSGIVPQGGTIDIEFDVYRHRLCPAVSKRQLTDADGVIHNIPVYTLGKAPELGRDVYKRSIDIPRMAAVGLATYRAASNCTAIRFTGLAGPSR